MFPIKGKPISAYEGRDPNFDDDGFSLVNIDTVSAENLQPRIVCSLFARPAILDFKSAVR